MPFRLIYWVSDCLYYLILKPFPYRDRIIKKNISLSFPNYTDQQVQLAQNKFYRYLVDLFLESIKVMSMNKDEILERMVVLDDEVMVQLFNEKKNVVVVLGHYGNFEYFGRILPFVANQYKSCISYQLIKNKYLNDFMFKNRTKFGADLISVKEVKEMFDRQKSGVPVATYFIMDQVPGAPHQSAHWMEFMHQDTPVINGPEKFGARFNQAVVFLEIDVIKRGYYSLKFHKICDDASKEKANFVTEQQMRFLEKSIEKKPAYWLWSHNRWKHKRKVHEST
ncbi:MAG: lysophospholipid acyltransferase family protein [Bacteroidetes bacterium]|nr:lysophospholipid acyltransferase family protein [Bacteroidota bacterium]